MTTEENVTQPNSENTAQNPHGGTSAPNQQKTAGANQPNDGSKNNSNAANSSESKTYYKESNAFENFRDGFDTWKVIKYIAIAFPFLLLYIYNSLHTAKAIKKKDELSKVLKELHSERISLESEITRASKQTQIAEKLKSTGLKEITTPPIKLTRERKD